MEWYYIDRAEYQLNKIKDAIEFLEDAMNSLREGKQFDCMDKMTKVHDIIKRDVVQESNGIIGNLKIDAEQYADFKKHMILSMYDYVPQWVDAYGYTDLRLLESYLSYKINGVTIDDIESEDEYGNVNRDEIYETVHPTPISELMQEFIEYKLSIKQ